MFVCLKHCTCLGFSFNEVIKFYSSLLFFFFSSCIIINPSAVLSGVRDRYQEIQAASQLDDAFTVFQ